MKIDNAEFNRIVNRFRNFNVNKGAVLSILPQITPGQAKVLFDKKIVTKNDLMPHLQKILRNRAKSAKLKQTQKKLKAIGFTEKELNNLNSDTPISRADKQENINPPSTGTVTTLANFSATLPRPIIVRTKRQSRESPERILKITSKNTIRAP